MPSSGGSVIKTIPSKSVEPFAEAQAILILQNATTKKDFTISFIAGKEIIGFLRRIKFLINRWQLPVFRFMLVLN